MKPSDRIVEIIREKLDVEKKKGMVLFPTELHHQTALDAILEYLDEQYAKK